MPLSSCSVGYLLLRQHSVHSTCRFHVSMTVGYRPEETSCGTQCSSYMPCSVNTTQDKCTLFSTVAQCSMRLIPSNSAAQKKHRCITPQKCVHILTPPADQPSTWAWAAFTIRAAARVASVRRRATVRAAARVASVRRRVAARAVLSIVLKALGDTVLTLHAVSLFAGATRRNGM